MIPKENLPIWCEHIVRSKSLSAGYQWYWARAERPWWAPQSRPLDIKKWTECPYCRAPKPKKKKGDL